MTEQRMHVMFPRQAVDLVEVTFEQSVLSEILCGNAYYCDDHGTVRYYAPADVARSQGWVE